MDLAREFKRNYELWLEREVFRYEVNWDELIGGDGSVVPGLATNPKGNPPKEQESTKADHDKAVPLSATSAGITSGTCTILRRSSSGGNGGLVVSQPSDPVVI